jgi:hypothetical protein
LTAPPRYLGALRFPRREALSPCTFVESASVCITAAHLSTLDPNSADNWYSGRLSVVVDGTEYRVTKALGLADEPAVALTTNARGQTQDVMVLALDRPAEGVTPLWLPSETPRAHQPSPGPISFVSWGVDEGLRIPTQPTPRQLQVANVGSSTGDGLLRLRTTSPACNGDSGSTVVAQGESGEFVAVGLVQRNIQRWISKDRVFTSRVFDVSQAGTCSRELDVVNLSHPDISRRLRAAIERATKSPRPAAPGQL